LNNGRFEVFFFTRGRMLQGLFIGLSRIVRNGASLFDGLIRTVVVVAPIRARVVGAVAAVVAAVVAAAVTVVAAVATVVVVVAVAMAAISAAMVAVAPATDRAVLSSMKCCLSGFVIKRGCSMRKNSW